MRFCTFSLCLAISVCLSSVQAITGSGNDIRTFEQFKTVFGKHYENAEVEALRRGHFQESLNKLGDLRLQHPTVEVGINEYSDLSSEEFGQMFPEPHIIPGHGEDFTDTHTEVRSTPAPVPLNFNWNDHIKISPIQNQGIFCGACWAFSSSAAVEAQYAIHKNISGLNLSKQELVDCSEKLFDQAYKNHGCYYGWDTEGYRYMRNHGVMEEQYYPYTGRFNETCMHHVIRAPHVYKIKTWWKYGFNQSDDAIRSLLMETGPLTVNLFATDDVFRHYRGGIVRYLYPNSPHINHSVLLVGFGYDKALNISYWVIRNSWGTSWGESGYARIERGYDQMGINNFISWPSLE